MNASRIFPVTSLLVGMALSFVHIVPAAVAQAESSDSPAEIFLPVDDDKTVLGWLEHIRVLPERTLLRAKLDSGARTSTIHAEDIEYSEYTGQAFVRFSILKDHDDPDSERFNYELPLQKHINIKLRYTPERDERPVVMLDICLAGTVYQVPFSLTERSDFNYPVLLGREFLQEHFLIDPSKTYTHRTRCRRQQ